MSIYEAERDLPECTAIYKQCDKHDCEKCTELACPVNSGEVPYEKVQTLMKSFMELKQKSRNFTLRPCIFIDCNDCPNDTCGVLYGFAPDPFMPEYLLEEWRLFWEECKKLLLLEILQEEGTTKQSDKILANAIAALQKWKEEGILEEKLTECGFVFLKTD